MLIEFLNKLKSQKFSVWGVPVIPLHYALLIFIVWLLFLALTNWINRDRWETLVHEQYGFSIDYPANWNYDKFGERGLKNRHDRKAHITKNMIGPFGPTTRAVYINWKQFDEPTIEMVDDWGKEQIADRNGTLTEIEEVHIGKGNYTALTRTFLYDDSSRIRIQYHVIHNDVGYLLEFYLNNENDMDELEPIFDHMLATFEIID